MFFVLFSISFSDSWLIGRIWINNWFKSLKVDFSYVFRLPFPISFSDSWLIGRIWVNNWFKNLKIDFSYVFHLSFSIDQVCSFHDLIRIILLNFSLFDLGFSSMQVLRFDKNYSSLSLSLWLIGRIWYKFLIIGKSWFFLCFLPYFWSIKYAGFTI